MSVVATLRLWLARCAGLFGRGRGERELSEELESHLRLQIAALEAGGLSPAAARREALLRSGGLEAAKEAYRDQRGLPAIEALAQDVRYATRSLKRDWSFTAAVVLSLAVGIGATSAVYTVVERVVLRPLPYQAPQQIVMLWARNTATGDRREVISMPDYTDWVTQGRTIERAAAFNIWSPTLRGADGPEQLTGSVVGAEFFRVLGVRPLLGRTLLAGEDVKGAPAVVVIAHSLWVRRFAGDPNIVGKTIMLDGDSFTVVGVMPPGFRDPEPLMRSRAEVWGALIATSGRSSRWLRAIARLKPGTTVAQAQHDLDLVAARLAQTYPEDKTTGVDVVAMQDQVVGKARPILLATLLAAGCVLLVVCGNVTNLVLVRHSARMGELALRSAVGASRARILRMLTVEHCILTAVGGSLALALAAAAIAALRHLAPSDLPRVNEIVLDRPVVAVTVLVTLVASCLFGVWPARRWWTADVGATLQGAGHRFTDRGRVRHAAVTLQLALSFALVVAASLLAKTLIRISEAPLGFTADHVLSMQLGLVGPRYDAPAADVAFFRLLTKRLEAIHGVQSAGMSLSLPVSGIYDMTMGVPGTDLTGESTGPQGTIHYRVATPHYRQTMRVRLLRGRDFTDADSLGRPVVALINRAAATRFFPGIDAIGHRVILNTSGIKSVEVVGVLDDVRYEGPMTDAEPEIFLPEAQQPWSNGAIVVRVSRDPMALVGAVRDVVRQLDPAIAVSDVQPMARVVASVTAWQRFYATLFMLFAVVALVVSAIGVYGVVAYTVAQRRREIGIRLALGARARDVMRQLVTRAAAMTAVGLILGTAAALAGTRLVASLLYGVAPRDPRSLVETAAVLAALALGAAIIGAARATRIAPSEALRAS